VGNRYEGWSISRDELLIAAASPPAQPNLNGSGPQASEPEILAKVVQAAMCQCGRTIHVSEETLSRAGIICGHCGGLFRPRFQS
jgi:hypothetical protein